MFYRTNQGKDILLNKKGDKFPKIPISLRAKSSIDWLLFKNSYNLNSSLIKG